MASTDAALDARFRVGLTALLLAIICFGATDLILDLPHLSVFHGSVEGGFLLFATLSVVYMWKGWVGARRTLASIDSDLAERQVERELWRHGAEKFLSGLGEEIDSQFARWALTPAEREVALLLLKGFGNTECAAILRRGEPSVEQDGQSVYQKSGLSSQAKLSAFFLSDLLLPDTAGDDAEAEDGPAA